MSVRCVAIAAIAVICIGAPLVEIVDQWDRTLQDGNDTEANVVIAALCVGLAFAIGTIVVVARIRAASSTPSLACCDRSPAPTVSWSDTPIPTESPPLPLRI